MELKSATELSKKAFKCLSNCWCEVISILFINIAYNCLFGILWLLIIGCFYGFGFTQNGTLFSVALDNKIGFGFITVGMLLICYIIKSPFNLGVSWYLFQISKGNIVEASSFFSCYVTPKRLFDTIKVKLIILAQKSFFFIPLIGIVILRFYISKMIVDFPNETFWHTLLTVCTVLLFCCLLVIYAFITLKYCLVTYIYVLNPNKNCFDIVSEGVKIMRGRQTYMVEIILSFVKWLIPCIMVFPIVFVIPYLTVIFSCAANEIITSYYSSDISSDEENAEEEIKLITSIF